MLGTQTHGGRSQCCNDTIRIDGYANKLMTCCNCLMPTRPKETVDRMSDEAMAEIFGGYKRKKV